MIVFLHKIDRHISIVHYWPINLYNVSYMVISKIILGRLRPLLDKFISPLQNTFVGIIDNTILSQEVINTMKRRRKELGPYWE